MATSLSSGQPLVTVDDAAPGVAAVPLARAESLNALTVDLVTELTTTLDRIALDRDCRCVVLTGAGRAFCAGLDLNGYGDDDRDAALGPPLAALARQRELAHLTTRIHRLPQPVVAAVN